LKYIGTWDKPKVAAGNRSFASSICPFMEIHIERVNIGLVLSSPIRESPWPVKPFSPIPFFLQASMLI